MTPTPVCRWCSRALRPHRGILACTHCDSVVCRAKRPCLTCTELMRVVADPEWSE